MRKIIDKIIDLFLFSLLEIGCFLSTVFSRKYLSVSKITIIDKNFKMIEFSSLNPAEDGLYLVFNTNDIIKLWEEDLNIHQKNQ